MDDISNDELIKKAESVVNSQKVGDFYIGDVGAALVSDKGDIYTGICIGSYVGICAEQSAIAAMVTAGELKIKKIVAVWKDENGVTYILPPCGRCREFIRQVHKDNRQTEVIVGKDKTLTLEELIPYYDSFDEPID